MTTQYLDIYIYKVLNGRSLSFLTGVILYVWDIPVCVPMCASKHTSNGYMTLYHIV